MMQIFTRLVPQLPVIYKQVTNLIYENWNHLLSNLNQPWLSPQCLQGFCNTIYQKEAALSHCWRFVDGTVCPISRANENQKKLYNGHKKVHGIKFRSVVAPDDLVVNLYGSVKGNTMIVRYLMHCRYILLALMVILHVSMEIQPIPLVPASKDHCEKPF